MESPPSLKKLLSTPTWATSSTSDQIAQSISSVLVVGLVWDTGSSADLVDNKVALSATMSAELEVALICEKLYGMVESASNASNNRSRAPSNSSDSTIVRSSTVRTLKLLSQLQVTLKRR